MKQYSGNIDGQKDKRQYYGGWALYRRWYGTSKFTERYTLHISDGNKPIALVDTHTYNNGNPIPAPVNNIRYQYDNHTSTSLSAGLGSACLELDSAASIISYEEYHPFGTTDRG